MIAKVTSGFGGADVFLDQLKPWGGADRINKILKGKKCASL